MYINGVFDIFNPSHAPDTFGPTWKLSGHNVKNKCTRLVPPVLQNQVIYFKTVRLLGTSIFQSKYQ